ncbi:hypothetical protein MKEN_01248000 [Mycena kentingensis (nom. inval.)]|nr:hypothetical protein MKEN_01248000 [Mycena kentingensis (nom. inval.)]
MTRSEVSEHSPRVVRKAFRAQARTQGLTYPQAIAAAKARQLASGKIEYPATDAARRNAGQTDDSFICPKRIDGGMTRMQQQGAKDAWKEFVEEDEEKVEEDRRPAPLEVSLMDIARPAKRRGGTKKFHVVSNVRRTLSVADSDAETEEWEQWEDQSEAWELESRVSEQWEIPARDFTAAEWEELYADKFENASAGPSRSYSQAVLTR